MLSPHAVALPADDALDPLAIDALLWAGRVEDARERTASALRVCPDVQRAPLLLRMAWCELAVSSPSGAHRAAADAAARFGADEEAAEPEVLALSAQSLAASRGGRPVEAIETALLARGLAESLPPGPGPVHALHALGVAYGVAHCVARARWAHHDALQAAAEAGLARALPELRLAQALTEFARLAAERADRDPDLAPDTTPLAALLDELEEGAAPASNFLIPGQGPAVAAAGPIVRRVARAWCGHPLAAASQEPGRDAPAWVRALHHWADAECAARAHALDVATAHATHMVAAATAAHHRPLQRLGRHVLVHLHERAGRLAEALLERRRLSADDRAQALCDLEARDASVQHRLHLREETRHRRALTSQSQAFERLAFEDALTGIANKRRFEQRLPEWSAQCEAAGEPLCAAVIDVDRFKQVNDTHTHVVGDEVLRRIAAIMARHVRAHDLPARFGGDEFVILFRNADEAAARLVCDRIEAAVRTHDWGAVAAGLSVTISIGVAQAQPGDTAADLIRRGDGEMYTRKRDRARPAPARAPRRPAAIGEPAAQQASGPLLERLALRWQRAAHVVVFTGQGPLDDGAWTDLERDGHGHAAARHADALAGATPGETHRLLAALARDKPGAMFVTQRVDGLLAAAGVAPLIELGGRLPIVRLPGEPPAVDLQAAVELAVKRADLVLVVDADPASFPGAPLLDKARFRGADVAFVGAAATRGGAGASLSIAGPAQVVLVRLLDRLRELAAETPEATPPRAP